MYKTIARGTLLTLEKIMVPRRHMFRKALSFTKTFFSQVCYILTYYLSVIGGKKI